MGVWNSSIIIFKLLLDLVVLLINLFVRILLNKMGFRNGRIVTFYRSQDHSFTIPSPLTSFGVTLYLPISIPLIVYHIKISSLKGPIKFSLIPLLTTNNFNNLDAFVILFCVILPLINLSLGRLPLSFLVTPCPSFFISCHV